MKAYELLVLFVLTSALFSGCGGGSGGGAGGGGVPLVIKVKTVASSPTNIYGIDMVIQIPNGVVINSSTAIGQALGSSINTNLVGQNLNISIIPLDNNNINLVPFALGDFLSINCTVPSGTTANNFLLQSFGPKDGNGAVIVVPVVTAEIY